MKQLLTSVASLGVLLTVAASARAELTLNPLFTDHAVLQRNMAVPVWGTADAGASVEVSFGGQTKSAEANADGKWMVKLDSLEASAEGRELTAKAGEETVTVSDVLVGEVWVCSGQSNMGFSVQSSLEKDAEEAATEADAGKYNLLRLFKVPVAGEDEPQSTVKAAWAMPTSQTVKSFTATGFFFGRPLQQALGIPVGLIQSANGGTNAYSWINVDTYVNDPVAKPSQEHFKGLVEVYPQAMEKYEAAKVVWAEKVKAAKAEGKTVEGRAPREPIGPDHVKRPTGHYNAMIAPLQPYAIQGAIWYQGEANSRPPFADQYKDLMLALIEDWRSDWAKASGGERRDFPFYLVQLPNFAGGDPWGWPVIREQILKVWQDGKNTGAVVTIDLGDANDIHPKNKKPVGERLAKFALAQAYKKDVVFSGPIYRKMEVDGSKAVIRFDYTGSGLTTTDGEAPKYVTIAGADGKFVDAEAKIEGDALVVSNPEVKEPVSVRYAWLNNPEGANLANKEGLMASPFRTDTDPIPSPAAQ